MVWCRMQSYMTTYWQTPGRSLVMLLVYPILPPHSQATRTMSLSCSEIFHVKVFLALRGKPTISEPHRVVIEKGGGCLIPIQELDPATRWQKKTQGSFSRILLDRKSVV